MASRRSSALVPIEHITQSILLLRGQKVLLDAELAALYGVTTKRFNEEAAKLPGVEIYTISMDLPFAQKRWCGAFGVDHVKMVSDHRDGSFGQAYGTLIKDLRIMSRAIFVISSPAPTSSTTTTP